MSEIAQLMLPAVRWDSDHGFAKVRPGIEKALNAGVGGFIFFGGPADQVRELIAHIVARSDVPLLIGADLERGAGQQFPGATGLPPLAAIGSLNNEDDTRAAARLTAIEAQQLGINWVYGPDCDLDIEPENPIIGTRSFGSDPQTVARHAKAWIDACQSQHVLACAKHFPGHGRTVRDSHAELPTVNVSREELDRTDLVPFRAAIEAGVASVMSAHVSFPALDPSGAPGTLSHAILTDLLRKELGFKGLVVTDALIMEGVLGQGGESGAVVQALNAGCDLLLYPNDIEAVERAITSAIAEGSLDVKKIALSLERRDAWVDWVRKSGPTSSLESDKRWASGVAERVVHPVTAAFPAIGRTVDVAVIDDDIGGPYPPPSRAPFIEQLNSAGYQASEGENPASKETLIALYGDIRAWKGRPGYSAKSKDALRRAAKRARDRGHKVSIVQFSHPRLAHEIPIAVPILCAWGGEEPMQRAAARVLARGETLK
jgi:beta-glucosidase-like glycosyl hydrolase